MLTFFVTMKGGSGKSTTICNLAPLVAAKQKTAIVDHDPNGTTSRWMEYRTETALPVIHGIHEPRHTPEGIQKILALIEDYDHVLFDTPGQDDSRTLIYYLADMNPRPMRFVVPVKPSQADIDLLPKAHDLIEIVRDKRAKAGFSAPDAYYLINEAPNTTKKERQDTLTAMELIGLKPIPSHVHARKAFRDSLATGESVAEMPKKARAEKAAEEIKSVFHDIFVRQPAGNRKTTGRQSKDNRRTMEAQSW